MKKQQVPHSLLSTTLLLIISLTMSSLPCTVTAQEAVFNSFEYRGEDALFDQPIDPSTTYRNPIVSGFYPDPSICRKGDDYYMVHSTFSYFPGIPLFHSRDLVHWEQLGNVLNRPSQLQLDGIRLDGGIYAPAINYNPHNDTFYIVSTCVDGIGNFVVKTQNPQSDWSDPIALPHVHGIDPSLFFDEGGQAYLVHNDSPAGTPEYEGHRAIWLHHYDTQNDQTFGEKKVLIDGGVDKSQHPIWIEGPHLYRINGRYYLMAAEGGTGENHSEVIFTADQPTGPFTPMSVNPILTQKDLAANRPEAVTCVGHADLIDTPQGDWYAVFLGCRPYQEYLYNTGRETFLLPVTWTDGVPIILEKGKAIPSRVTPQHWQADTKGITPEALTGNFTWRDDFDGDKLALRWLFIRTPQTTWWTLQDGKLCLTPTPHTLYEIGSPAFIGYRQQHTSFTASTLMDFNPKNEKEIAGLVCYQNERYNIVLGKTIRQGVPVLTLVTTDNGKQTTQATVTLHQRKHLDSLHLRVIARGATYHFAYSYNGNEWNEIAIPIDATILSTHKAGGFMGAVIGMYTAK